MNCTEVKSLQGAYLDSELDPRTTLEVQEHLKSCPECAGLVAEEQKQDVCIAAGLNRGEKTGALWQQIERSVAGAAVATGRGRRPSHFSRAEGWHDLLSECGERLQAGWRRWRWAWSGLTAAWVAIIVLDFSAREPDTTLVAERGGPSVSEMRLAWKQKERLMANLGVSFEPAPADRAKPALPSPRSDRHNGTLNT